MKLHIITMSSNLQFLTACVTMQQAMQRTVSSASPATSSIDLMVVLTDNVINHSLTNQLEPRQTSCLIALHCGALGASSTYHVASSGTSRTS